MTERLKKYASADEADAALPVPVGEIAFRTDINKAICFNGTAWIVYWTTQELLDEARRLLFNLVDFIEHHSHDSWDRQQVREARAFVADYVPRGARE